ncbi:MAG: rhomboid family intramembrane serine protease [Proteobacteria bacterium]|nr:rhomboid family intramembrane serine protease [Pseudomonadota bacterium]MBS0463915.1 rhomboid family intramembrane serine protease [Pseudomonadota bacterium]
MDAPVSTLVLIGITCLISLVAMGNHKLLAGLIFWPPAIVRDRQWWRLLSYGFVHADGMHLLFNMFTLYFFGRAMEGFVNAHLGDWGFAFFYLSALVASILPTFLRHREDPKYLALGASGAVLAVLFSFILLKPWALIIVFVVPMPAIVYAALFLGYSIWMDRRGAKDDRTNHGAHLAGAIYGVLFTVLMEPRVVGYFLGQLAHPSLGY